MPYWTLPVSSITSYWVAALISERTSQGWSEMGWKQLHRWCLNFTCESVMRATGIISATYNDWDLLGRYEVFHPNVKTVQSALCCQHTELVATFSVLLTNQTQLLNMDRSCIKCLPSSLFSTQLCLHVLVMSAHGLAKKDFFGMRYAGYKSVVESLLRNHQCSVLSEFLWGGVEGEMSYYCTWRQVIHREY